MKIEKIVIETQNNKHATDIALLVDKLEFLGELNRLRNKWEISKLYRPSALNVFLKLHIMTKNKTITNEAEMQKRLSEFYDDIHTLLNKFNRGKNFKPVVEFALATGIVPNGVYRSCYFDVVTINENESLESPERYKFVIVMSPRTELKEVKEVYKEFENYIEGKRNFEARNSIKGSILTDTDIKEGNELIELIAEQHDSHIKNLENNFTQENVKQEYLNFMKATTLLRHKLNLLSLKAPLNEQFSGDAELIRQFHKGEIYHDEFNTLSTIHRTRDWYWMRYGDTFNDASKAPVTSQQVYFNWYDKCPTNNNHANKEEKKKCDYCSAQSWNNVEVALKNYKKLLSFS